MIPHRVPFFIPLLYPTLHWRIPTEAKTLYLTFDDGPIPGPTEFVLEQLRAFKAKATFFSIGDNVRKHPQIFEKIIQDGHTIGNHTYNHLSGWASDDKLYLNNISDFENVVKPFGIEKLSLFRPPYGRIKRSQIKSLQHYKIIMWDVLSFDFNKNLSPDRCLSRTIDAVRPGSIVVFHDSHKAQRNMMYALPRFIEHFMSAGFTFERIP